MADIENVLVIMINRIMPPSLSDPPQGGGGALGEREGVEHGLGEGGRSDSVDKEGEGSGEGEKENVGMKEGEEGERRRVESDSREDEGVEGDTEEEGDEKEKGGGGKRKETENDRQPGQNVGEEEEGKQEDGGNGINIGPIPRMICHVLETADVRCIYTHVHNLNSYMYSPISPFDPPEIRSSGNIYMYIFHVSTVYVHVATCVYALH